MPQRRDVSVPTHRSFSGDLEQERRREIRNAFDGLGPVVYFMRVDGLIKIGHSTDLRTRRRKLTSDLTAILAIVPGDMSLEAQMHERFVGALAKGKEWFHPTPDLIAYINELREKLGVKPIAA